MKPSPPKATITSATTDAAGSAGAAVDETRLPGVITPNNRRMTVRDLLMPGQMDGGVLEYVRETGFANNAAPVAEGARKPESDIQLELVSTSAKAGTLRNSARIVELGRPLRRNCGIVKLGRPLRRKQSIMMRL